MKKGTYITINIALLIVLSFGFGLFKYHAYRSTVGMIDMVSVSTDGHYALTSDEKEYITLWDLEQHTKKIISRKAHVWQAYFIPNSHTYVWQDQNMVMHIESVEKGPLKTMKLPFLVYGFVMSKSLNNFMAGDISNGLHWYKDKKFKTILKPDSEDPREFLADKPINLTLVPNSNKVTESYISGLGNSPKSAVGVRIFNIQTGKLLNDLIGDVSHTFATISPDGKYVVAGDMNGTQFVWNLETGKRVVQILAAHPVLKFKHPAGAILDYNVVAEPKDFYDNYNIQTIKYIDKDHYLVFYNQSQYTILFKTLNPKPIKYLDLGTNPWPATSALERDQAIDTSPSAHVLVIAKRDGPGILVYHYDPKSQTLKKVWDAK